MKRIKILGTAVTARHGTLSAGDIITAGDDFADHLVNVCKVAEYLDISPQPEQSQADPVADPVDQVTDPIDPVADPIDQVTDPINSAATKPKK